MKRTVFLDQVNNLFSRCIQLLDDKGSDYATEGDVFSTQRLCEKLEICDVEQGILSRICEKLGRIAHILGYDDVPTFEDLEDSLMDLINYSAMLAVYLQSKKEVEKK